MTAVDVRDRATKALADLALATVDDIVQRGSIVQWNAS